MLGNRNLRFLVVGQFVSALGDHFYLVAMPWLALELTGSGLVAGTVLAVASLPRALFLLIGGAATDRYSAKRLLVAANGVQGVLMVLLGVAALLSFTPLWLLYAMSFLTGLVDAFGVPAFSSVLPRVVPSDKLESGNVALQGANMASGVIGPAAAGAVIAAATVTSAKISSTGLGAAFLINAVSFFIGVFLFWQMKPAPVPAEPGEAPPSLVRSLADLKAYIGGDQRLKSLLALMALLGLFLTGTIRVGFPLLAKRQFAGNVQAFGNMNSAFFAGLLGGMIALRLLPRPSPRWSGLLVLGLFAVVPAGLVLLGLQHSYPATLLVVVGMGAAFGYVLIMVVSWLQRRTPPRLLGRMMAVVSFTGAGLAPLSQTLMGYALDRDLALTFIGVGSLVLLLLAGVATNRNMWALDEPAAANADAPAAR